MSPFFIGPTGRRIFYEDPFGSISREMLLREVAAGLSKQARFGNHTAMSYYVAQHCVLCTMLSDADGQGDEVALRLLLHDATEAYLGDMPNPHKQRLPDYRALEAHFEEAILSRLGLDLAPDLHPTVKRYDFMAMVLEMDRVGFGSERYGCTTEIPTDCRRAAGQFFNGGSWGSNTAAKFWFEHVTARNRKLVRGGIAGLPHGEW